MEDRLEQLNTEYKQKPSEELRKQIHEELMSRNESTLDLENLPKVNHRWVDRGTILSCEGAGHPNHRHYKMK